MLYALAAWSGAPAWAGQASRLLGTPAARAQGSPAHAPRRAASLLEVLKRLEDPHADVGLPHKLLVALGKGTLRALPRGHDDETECRWPDSPVAPLLTGLLEGVRDVDRCDPPSLSEVLLEDRCRVDAQVLDAADDEATVGIVAAKLLQVGAQAAELGLRRHEGSGLGPGEAWRALHLLRGAKGDARRLRIASWGERWLHPRWGTLTNNAGLHLLQQDLDVLGMRLARPLECREGDQVPLAGLAVLGYHSPRLLDALVHVRKLRDDIDQLLQRFGSRQRRLVRLWPHRRVLSGALRQSGCVTTSD